MSRVNWILVCDIIIVYQFNESSAQKHDSIDNSNLWINLVWDFFLIKNQFNEGHTSYKRS
jgi:hypothetical protein